MKAFMRGAAVLFTTAATLISAAAFAQDKTVLTTEREKASYMVGIDIAQSIAPVAPGSTWPRSSAPSTTPSTAASR